MRLNLLTSITAILLVAIMIELLRRRQLREKYAAFWMAVGAGVIVLGIFPRLLDSLARVLGVASGASLVLFLGIVFLLLVCIHLSWETSRLEEETRTLAEEIALIRLELAEQERLTVEPAERERLNDQ